MKLKRPLPKSGETDCPSCKIERSVARHNSLWTCYVCAYAERVDEERTAGLLIDSMTDDEVLAELAHRGVDPEESFQKLRAMLNAPAP